MNLRLNRDVFTDVSTTGILEINDITECFTLEDTDRKLEGGGEKIQGQTAIPRGKYKVIISMSNRFKKRLPLLLNVPQFTGVRIHPGNKPEHTEGCILVGRKTGENVIYESKLAFDSLFTKMTKADEAEEEIWMEVV